MGNNKAKKRVIMGQWGIIMAQCGSILLIGIPLGQVGVSRVTMAQFGGRVIKCQWGLWVSRGLIAQCIYNLKEIKTNFIYFSAFLDYIIQL